MKLNKFLCLFVLLAVVFAFASCDVLASLGIGGSQVEQFEVKFDSKGGTEVASQMVDKDGLVTEPEAPTREGYTFDGWYLGGKPWNFAENTVTKSVTLMAKWTPVVEKFDVTFDSQGGTAVDAQSVKKGGLVTEPFAPTKDGYNFLGWFNGDAKWDFSADKVLANVSLVAKWECAHKDVAVLDAVAATCTTDGLTEGAKCNVCGVVTVEQVVVPAAHTVMIDNKVEPTCGATGLTEGSHCTVCNEVIVAQEAIPATGEHTPGEAATCLNAQTCIVCGGELAPAAGHTEEAIPAVDATCTENGWTAGSKCSVCGETTVAPTLVPAIGHKDEILPAVAPGCETEGKTEGKQCSVCGLTSIPQEAVPANGHTPGAVADCTNAQVCTVCGEELVPALGHTEEIIPAVDPDCENAGLTEGKKCSVCGETTVAQQPVEALGHTPGEAASCTTAQVCSVCGDVLVEALGHKEEDLAAVEPGCETTGLTAGKKCTVCGIDTVPQVEIPEKGHNFVDGLCTVCGEDVSYKIYYYVEGKVVYTGKYFDNLGLETLDEINVPGYIIHGWYDMFSTSGEAVTSIPAGRGQEVHLNADAELIEYTITYIVDGVSSTQIYTVSTEDIPLIDIPSKEHHDIIGWQDADGHYVSVIAAGTVGNMTFTAVYEEITYTITYVLDGGENDERNVAEFKFSALPALYNPLNREGYLFQGWFATPEFDGIIVTSLENATGNITLYAKWTEMPNNDGTLTPEVPF